MIISRLALVNLVEEYDAVSRFPVKISIIKKHFNFLNDSCLYGKHSLRIRYDLCRILGTFHIIFIMFNYNIYEIFLSNFLVGLHPLIIYIE